MAEFGDRGPGTHRRGWQFSLTNRWLRGPRAIWRQRCEERAILGGKLASGWGETGATVGTGRLVLAS